MTRVSIKRGLKTPSFFRKTTLILLASLVLLGFVLWFGANGKDFDFLVPGKFNVVFVLNKGCGLCDQILPSVYGNLKKIEHPEVCVSIAALETYDGYDIPVVEEMTVLKRLSLKKVPAVILYSKNLSVVHVIRNANTVKSFVDELKLDEDPVNTVSKYLVMKNLADQPLWEKGISLFVSSECSSSLALMGRISNLSQYQRDKIRIVANRNASSEFLELCQGFSIEQIEEDEFLNGYNIQVLPTLVVCMEKGTTKAYGVSYQYLVHVLERVNDE